MILALGGWPRARSYRTRARRPEEKPIARAIFTRRILQFAILLRFACPPASDAVVETIGEAGIRRLVPVRHPNCKEGRNPQPAMIQTLSNSRPRYKVVIGVATASLALLAFPTLARLQQTHSFSSGHSQPGAQSADAAAIAEPEWRNVQQLKQKFSSASAQDSVRMPQITAAVSKMMDLDRHREELGDRYLFTQPAKEIPASAQTLSVLPR